MINFGNIDGINAVTICWIIFILYWIISSFFVKKTVVKRGPKWILWRIIIVIIVIIFIRLNNLNNDSLLYIFQSTYRFELLGSIITIFGLFFAIWARINLGKNWSGYVTYKENQELIMSGSYKLVRHPIYTSIILMIIGTILYYGSIFALIMLIISSIMFIIRSYKEEKIMIKLFGKKYQDYMRKSKRFLPFLY